MCHSKGWCQHIDDLLVLTGVGEISESLGVGAGEACSSLRGWEVEAEGGG